MVETLELKIEYGAYANKVYYGKCRTGESRRTKKITDLEGREEGFGKLCVTPLWKSLKSSGGAMTSANKFNFAKWRVALPR